MVIKSSKKLNDYLFYKEYAVRLFLGNCLDVLKKIPNDYVNAILCDPPYGISFLGKNWDKAVPSVEIWKECLRVLKPGAFAFIMSIPRMDCQAKMIMNLQEAGFDVSFSPIYWTYAQGWPKSVNISKKIDKKMGVYVEGKILPSSRVVKNENNFTTFVKKTAANPQSEDTKKFDGWYSPNLKPAVEIILMVMKPLEKKTFTEQALCNGHGIINIDACRIPYANDAEKTVGGRNKPTTSEKTMYGRDTYFESKTKTEHAPAAEQGRFPSNLLAEDDILNDGVHGNSIGHSPNLKTTGYGTFGGGKAERVHGAEDTYIDDRGRYPSNLLSEDDVLDNGIISKTRPHSGTGEAIDTQNQGWGFKRLPFNGYDSGSFSRYFSLSAWWEKKIKQLPESTQKTFPFLITPKASRKEKGFDIGSNTYNHKCLKCGKWERKQQFSDDYTCHCENPEWEKSVSHPTVKPLKLFSWLVMLSSREGDIILDPFVGSGTTCIAAKMLKRKSIGIEINKEYCEIAQKRIESVV